jgi:hypothetical protein
MKKLLLICLAVLTLAACDKNDEFNTDHDRLVGFWSLTNVSGGFAGTGYEANFDHLQINERSTYSLMVHDAFIQEGSYELRREDGQLLIRFIPNSSDTLVFADHEKAVIFNEHETQLTLSDPCCDLYVYSFEKEGD